MKLGIENNCQIKIQNKRTKMKARNFARNKIVTYVKSIQSLSPPKDLAEKKHLSNMSSLEKTIRKFQSLERNTQNSSNL